MWVNFVPILIHRVKNVGKFCSNCYSTGTTTPTTGTGGTTTPTTGTGGTTTPTTGTGMVPGTGTGTGTVTPTPFGTGLGPTGSGFDNTNSGAGPIGGGKLVYASLTASLWFSGLVFLL